MIKLLFIGVPGCGKGTQAKLLEQNGFIQISTGELIRKACEENNSIIKPYQKKIEEGNLLPDNILLQLIEKKISELPEQTRGIIFDGAVRTIEQAKYFISKNLIDLTLFFSLPIEQAEKRLLDRNEGREDDQPETIKKRFEVYREKTAPILDYLKSNTKFQELDASGTVEDIHLNVQKILNIFNLHSR